MPCHPDTCFKDESGGPGAPGDAGDIVSAVPPTAAPGAAGHSSVESAFFTDFISVINPYYSSILLHEAENYYINGDVSNTTNRLIWLKGLLEARIVNTKQLLEPDLKAFESHRYRVNSLLNQISLSLDFYGQFNNVVPLLTVESIIQELDALLAYGKEIEQAYFSYKSSLSSKEIDQLSLNSARSKLLQQNDDARASLADNIKQRTDLENNVAVLNEQLQSLWAQMAQADANFKKAVANRSNGCDFGQVVAIGAMVASLVTTGGTAYAAVAPALAALKGEQQEKGQTVPVPDTFEGFKYKVNTVVTLGKDAKDFGDALKKLGSNAPQPTGPALLPAPPNDEAKIIASVKDIDAELDKYRDLPEAKAYRALIDSFAATAQAKNNMIGQVNSLYAAWDSTNSQINKNVIDATVLQNKISDKADPRLASAVLFMESAYRQAMNSIKYALYSVYRAYTYYSLDDVVFFVDDTSVTTLGHSKNNVVQQYYNALAGFGAAPTPFSVTVDIRPYLSDQELKEFAKGHKALNFSLPIDASEFKALSQVMVNKIGVTFRNKTSVIQDFTLNFTHHGHSVMLGADGSKHVFLHTPIHVPYGVDAAGNETINGDFSGQFTSPPAAAGGSHLYNGVSPYGPWTIDISTMDEDKRATISNVRVRFAGYARGRNPT